MRLPEYWDAYTVVGPRENKHPAERWSLDDLRSEMEHCRIAAAMVLSTQSVHYDPHTGNVRLAQELAGSRRLFPVWNALPSASGEFPEAAQWLRQLREQQIRAVSFFPKTNGWDLFDPSSRPLLKMLSQEGVPVYLPRREFGAYSELRALLTQWPDLRVILPEASWTDQRFLIPLLKAHRHLHITFDQYQSHYAPEDLVGMGLEDQLLYGSNAPKMAMGAHRCMIDYAEVSPAVIEKLASGNLCRLLGLERAPFEAAPEPKNDDVLMQAARAGKPLPMPVIDMHMHILDEGLNGGGGSYRMKEGGPQGVLRLLKRLGCTGGGLMSWNGTVSADSLTGNVCTRNALERFPSGFWGLGSFDPSHYDQQTLICAIRELYSDPRFRGMKPYRTYGIPYDDPLYEAWWQYGNQKRLYALIHRIRHNFSEVTTLAEKYPQVQWVVAHCGASFAVADGAIEAIRRFPNIHAEITLTTVGGGVIEYLVDGCGSDRVLYGSDLPMRDPRPQLGWVVFSRLPLESKMNLLGTNAERLMSGIRR